MTHSMTEPAAAGVYVPGAIRHGHRAAAAGPKNSKGRAFLKWLLRLLVAIPAAYVGLGHVHETAQHFGQSGAMGWAEAIGMEALSALALMEIDEARHRRGHGSGRRPLSLPWALLFAAIALSLGSNIFAVLQAGGPSRSFGGVVYGGWPTLAFLAVAWLWHAEAERSAAAIEETTTTPGVDVDDDAGAQLVDVAPTRPTPAAFATKRDAVRAIALWELDYNGHPPKPTDLAREVDVSSQYAGRVLEELLRQPVSAP